MTDKYYKLCAALLEMASNEFSNHGCNDMPDEFFIGWTKEERQQLAKDFEDYNSEGKDYDPNNIHIPDSSLMSFFAHKLSEHSALKEQWISVEEPPVSDEPGFVGVLIALKSGVVRQGWFNTKTNNFQTIGHDVYEKERVTHYMITPEPPPVKK